MQPKSSGENHGAHLHRGRFSHGPASAKAHALIELAATVRDWWLLEQAVDAEISDQQALVEQQVSRWRTRLNNAEKYREQQIIIATLRKAGIEPVAYSIRSRIGAALGMTVEDVFTQQRRLWVRLREKGGKPHAMPCHHNLESYLSAYIEGAGLADDPRGPLFRTIGRGTGLLTRNPLPQANAYQMIRRRAAAAGIMTKLGNHSFRATGITAYLKNGGTLEKAAQMANHASTRTTQLYDRRRDDVSLDEVEKIRV